MNNMWYFSQKKLDEERSNCVRTVTDRALTAVRTDLDTARFSLADTFVIGLWLLPLHLETKFTTLCP